jgi:hypothetical protein
VPQLLVFITLQALDLLSTLLFLRHGVAEANPLMRAALAAVAVPALALALPKLGGMVLALAAWRSGRVRMLRTVNIFFTLCVVWNLAAAALA